MDPNRLIMLTKCQRLCISMFVNMQGWIFHKETKIKQKPGKTCTRVRRGQKVKARNPKVHISPSTTQDWQERPLKYTFEVVRFSPCNFKVFHK